MSRIIDYYFSAISPWTYLGHAPFHELAKRHGATINYKPVKLGQVFGQTGGLPLAKRHTSRQRYRIFELKRWGAKRQVPIHIEPKYWPLDPALADRCVIALVHRNVDPEPFLSRVHKGIWEDEENLADEAVVARMLKDSGHDADAILNLAQNEATEIVYQINLENAVEAGVFGAPSYVIEGEIFWGQDRLDLLDEMLASGRAAYTAN